MPTVVLPFAGSSMPARALTRGHLQPVQSHGPHLSKFIQNNSLRVVARRWVGLSWAILLLLWTQPLFANELPPSAVRLAWLRTGPDVDPTSALETWAQEARLRTSVVTDLRPVAIKPEDPAIFRYPLLYWTGDRAPPHLSDQAIAHLRQHLSTGGTLLVDNAGRAEASAAFDAGVRRELLRIFPQALQKVPPGHVIFRSFYRLDQAVGRRADSRDLEGLRIGSHFAVVMTRNDVGGALARQSLGGYAQAVVPGGETQRELAIRLAINVLLYAMNLDYKDDHTHVLYLLRHRRGAATP